MIRTKDECFSTLRKIKYGDKALLLTHIDADGAGPVVLLKYLLGEDNVEVKHCSNSKMSWEIGTSVQTNDIASKYDIIIATDISCNAITASYIDKNNNKSKFVLLDHHNTALGLDKYNWACIQSDIISDSYRMPYYDNLEGDKHSSGTSLMYDYLEYCCMFENKPAVEMNIIKDFVHTIAAYDTWDWNNVFGKAIKYKQMATIFDAYGTTMFERRFLEKITSHEKLLDKFDLFIVEAEETKMADFLEVIKTCINTGTLCFKKEDDSIDATSCYSITYCNCNNHTTEVFEIMKEMYPDADLHIINYGGGISFRTAKPSVNVGELLLPLGGGGHPGAGGVKIPFDTEIEKVQETLNAIITLDERE